MSQDKNGLIVSLTKERELLVLGKSDDAKIATEVGQEWFEDSAMTLEQYKDTIVEGSDYDLVKEINSNQKYQNQIIALEKEKVAIEKDLQATQKNKDLHPSEQELGFS